jgi:putative ABC transport system ATP-binding protein
MIPDPLTLRGVSKTFRQGASLVEALSSIYLSISPGEFVAVMGASGSGKSTLLHVAAGLTNPDFGEILIEDQPLAGLSDSALTRLRRRKIGLVFQSFNLIPTLSAEDNILLPTLAGAADASTHDLLESLLRRLSLAGRRKHRPDALSGGEQQRVAIARALICHPALVLADEPTGSLDSVTGQEICKLLRELCTEQQRSILLVTHEAAVARWADRVVILKDGRNIAEFPTAGLVDSHALADRYLEIVNRHDAAGARP